MGKINAKGMSNFEAQHTKRVESLRALITKPFDYEDSEHQRILKKYMDDFELLINQLYLYQALSESLKVWFSSWVIAQIVPIPEFVNSILATTFYLGFTACVLKHFSMSDFHLHLEEMKIIYNWCLKNNSTEYDISVDNSLKLDSSMIQRLIKLLAPVCETEFMIAWKKEVECNDVPSGSWAKVFNAGRSAFSATFSLFSGSTKPQVDHNTLQDLKVKVETRGLDVDTFNGFKQAMNYFIYSFEYKKSLKSLLLSPRPILEKVVPSSVMEIANSGVAGLKLA